MDNTVLRDLFILERDYNYFINRRLKEFKIKKNDVRIMKVINENKGIAQNEICNLVKEDKVTVAKSIKKLEEKEYIKRVYEHDDKRIANIYLTDEGFEVRKEALKIFKELDNILMKDLSDKNRASVKELLEMLSKNMNEESNRIK